MVKNLKRVRIRKEARDDRGNIVSESADFREYLQGNFKVLKRKKRNSG